MIPQGSPLSRSAIFVLNILGALWPEISVVCSWAAAIAYQPVRLFFLKHYLGMGFAHFIFVVATHQKTPIGR